jgi:7-keto-8-aminopelargonate synthetase-like enzyme
VGGFVASERSVIDYLKHTARPFVFSASLPPGSVAAAAAALQILRTEPERRQHLMFVANLLRDELRAHGFSVLPGETAIVPVVIQDELDLCRLCKALLEEGIYINPVLRPAAAQNLLRISCTAAHTDKHVEKLISTLVRVSAALGIER